VNNDLNLIYKVNYFWQTLRNALEKQTIGILPLEFQNHVSLCSVPKCAINRKRFQYECMPFISYPSNTLWYSLTVL